MRQRCARSQHHAKCTVQDENPRSSNKLCATLQARAMSVNAPKARRGDDGARLVRKATQTHAVCDSNGARSYKRRASLHIARRVQPNTIPAPRSHVPESGQAPPPDRQTYEQSRSSRPCPRPSPLGTVQVCSCMPLCPLDLFTQLALAGERPAPNDELTREAVWPLRRRARTALSDPAGPSNTRSLLLLVSHDTTATRQLRDLSARSHIFVHEDWT